MKLSEKWLREWVNPKIDVNTLAEQLTMAGLEVDSVTPVAGSFNNVVVGYVKQVEQHPNAERLTLCQVDVGDNELLNIVCGATNVRANLKVAVAKIGAKLPNDFEIKKAKLRGAISEGMLCSSSELGLTEESEGILELDAEAPIGQDLRQYLLLDDNSLTLELTPNRGDCLSVAGVAREVAVLNNLVLNAPKIEPVKPSHDQTKTVSVEHPAGCAQYYGRVIRNINPNISSPVWLVEKLRRSGLRSISAIVDITNYVMLELGQPLHAFDLHKISGDIVVRLAHADETLTLLDGQKINLKDNSLVIADATGAIAIAGIMGGLSTAVTTTTQEIFLESAFFTQEIIAGRARSYGYSTESSHRFERGVDPAIQLMALERASQLLVEITGAQAGPITSVSYAEYLPTTRMIKLRTDKVEKLLGICLSEKQMLDCLQNLGMSVFAKGDSWEVKIPSSRFDIVLEVDLIEEIARIYGYNNIPQSAFYAQLSAQPVSEVTLPTPRFTQALIERGYHETISYSFVDPRLQALIYPDGENIDLLNPLSPELSQMRKGLWPGLLAAVLYNQYRQIYSMRLFEDGVRFIKNNGEILQQAVMAGVIVGNRCDMQWNEATKEVDFFDIKGDIEALLKMAYGDENYQFTAMSHPALHPGQSACIKYHDKQIGWVGSLHPQLIQELDLVGPVLVFELEIGEMARSAIPKFRPVSKYPSIRRDLSFLVDKTIAAGDICSFIKQEASEILQSVAIFDMYEGSGIELNKKSLAIALILQHPSHTLIDSEISSYVDAIINKLRQNFNITLRE